MGKKRKILNSPKYANKYSNHPLARARAEKSPIVEVAEAVTDTVEEVVEAVAETVQAVVETAAETVQSVVEDVAETVQSAVEDVTEVVKPRPKKPVKRTMRKKTTKKET